VQSQQMLSGGDFFAEFDVPVGEVEEVFPAVVVRTAEIDLHEWAPLRTLRLADQMHPGFEWGAVRLARVALDAGANNILPGRWTAAIARNDMVEVQVFAIKDLSAVLTRILVPLKDVVPRELHLFLGHAVEKGEDNDPRDSNAKANGTYAFGVRLFAREVVPLLEVISLERPIRRIQNNLRVAFKQKGESPPGGANVDRLPKPVENQDLLVQERIHTFRT
jgi:hypothetical protein